MLALILKSKYQFEPRPWHLPLAVITLSATLALFSYLDLGKRRRGDVTVRRMYQHINIGGSRQDVLDVFWRDMSFGSLLDTNTTRVWKMFPSGTRTSRSWFLLIEFRDDLVSAVKVRDIDGLNPRSAPADKANNAAR